MKQSILSDEDIEKIINSYKNGESIRKIAEHSKVGRTRINTILNQNNIEMKSVGNSYNLSKYTLDEHYFDIIDTADKAYWLGFISADGHISDDGIMIVLQYQDKHHLIKFLKSINSNAPIKYRKETNSFVVSVYSLYMVQIMRKMKFYKNKSQTQTFPEAINENLYRHFIRGIWDGDGSICTYQRMKKRYKKLTREHKISVCGQIKLIDKIKNIIISSCNVNETKIQMNPNGFSIIEWSGKIQCLKILDWLYQDANIYLERKYEKYILFQQDNDPEIRYV